MVADKTKFCKVGQVFKRCDVGDLVVVKVELCKLIQACKRCDVRDVIIP